MFCAEMRAGRAAAVPEKGDAYRTPVPEGVPGRNGRFSERRRKPPSVRAAFCAFASLRSAEGASRGAAPVAGGCGSGGLGCFGFLLSLLCYGIRIFGYYVVALIMFQIYRFTRGTNALRIVAGILLVYLLWVVVKALNMELLSMILGQVIGVGVIALIVVFQPELRRFLTLLGTQYTNRRVSFLSRLFRPRGRAVNVVGQEWIETVIRACSDMAATKTGALIVIARSVNLLPIIEKGERIDALISAPLLENIFFKNSPLHDGAVVIANGRVAAAKCVLPSTEREVPMEFGMRHRAALGASEVTDALVVVVSEERGTISVARKGHISRNITPAHLRVLLRKGLSV